MNQKEAAARRALDYVKSGMILGLGSGSTAAYFVDMLGVMVSSGELTDIQGIPTSRATAERAREWGIPLTTLAENPILDLAVDGADEVDPNLNLIKGLGRAALREKIVESHAKRLIIIVDESKIVDKLGRGPLPVEIIQFEHETHIRWLRSLGCKAELWLEDDGSPIVTDNGNYLVRCWFADGIGDADRLSMTLSTRPGIVGHGLFLNMADTIIVAGNEGVQIIGQS
ncbi:MAG: ribose-5-phosphate isomerase RpiA [Anaerolineales bacterium]|nr:ribose-5-phosphate isomerase RpiA [Chloroflexota bacterium]MBL6982935.1 ribose-5-phosphate isomerase RpiA [Anaerolineales bacterium]